MADDVIGRDAGRECNALLHFAFVIDFTRRLGNVGVRGRAQINNCNAGRQTSKNIGLTRPLESEGREKREIVQEWYWRFPQRLYTLSPHLVGRDPFPRTPPSHQLTSLHRPTFFAQRNCLGLGGFENFL